MSGDGVPPAREGRTARAAGRSPAAKAAPRPTKVERRDAARRRSQRRRLLWSLLVVLVVVAVGLAVAAETVLSYDYRTLDQDYAASAPLVTGDFADEYAQTTTAAVRDIAVQTQAVVDAEVVTSGVVSATPDEVVVLVFVDQTTTSTGLDEPQTAQNRLRMTMDREGDRWLVAQVDAL